MKKLLLSGVSDEVKCFYCDGGLKAWVPGDNPWEEHAIWHPACDYLRVMKGLGFIRQAQEKAKRAKDFAALPFSCSDTATADPEDQASEETRHVEGESTTLAFL